MEVNIIAESLIKIEVKEEQFYQEDNPWNSREEDEPSPKQHSVKTENNEDEELESPIAVFIEPIEMHESSCIEGEKDPLAPSCEGASSRKQEDDLCSPDDEPNHLASIIRKKARTQNDHLETQKSILTNQKQFQCSSCQNSFNDKRRLNIHMRIHSGGKLFQCYICEEHFASKRNLQRHMSIHTGETPFECSICLKKIKQKEDLIRHMRIHTGEKPFQCSICQKSFVQKGNFNRHMRMHKVKPFECSICQKSFVCEGDVKRHMRIHTDEKTFECSICRKRFIQKGKLNRHMRIHNG